MRFRELVQAIQESMSFSAGAKGEDNMWRSSVDSGDRYHPDVTKQIIHMMQSQNRIQITNLN